jgi:hypothetical protein
MPYVLNATITDPDTGELHNCTTTFSEEEANKMYQSYVAAMKARCEIPKSFDDYIEAVFG